MIISHQKYLEFKNSVIALLSNKKKKLTLYYNNNQLESDSRKVIKSIYGDFYPYNKKLNIRELINYDVFLDNAKDPLQPLDLVHFFYLSRDNSIPQKIKELKTKRAIIIQTNFIKWNTRCYGMISLSNLSFTNELIINNVLTKNWGKKDGKNISFLAVKSRIQKQELKNNIDKIKIPYRCMKKENIIFFVK